MAKDQGGWVLILSQPTGEVRIHEGYLPIKEAQRQARRAAGSEGETGVVHDGVLPASLLDYKRFTVEPNPIQPVG